MPATSVAGVCHLSVNNGRALYSGVEQFEVIANNGMTIHARVIGSIDDEILAVPYEVLMARSFAPIPLLERKDHETEKKRKAKKPKKGHTVISQDLLVGATAVSTVFSTIIAFVITYAFLVK